MLYKESKFPDKWNILSWQKCRENIFRLQRRIFKAVQVGDVRKALELQKLLLRSNSARLLSIRYVTQVSLKRKVSGIDGKVSLNFNERFELSTYLLANLDNWNPQNFKKVFVSTRDGLSLTLNVPTISDRAWCCLISFALEPAQEAVSSPRSFKFGSTFSAHELQKILFLNLSKSSFAVQKRALLIDLVKYFSVLDINKFLLKVLAPRSVKIGIFRFLRSGFQPNFDEQLNDIEQFGFLLANILLNGIENLHNGFRYVVTLIFN